jgi:FlaA1/EpsC-like NDP-sugar epimerase
MGFHNSNAVDVLQDANVLVTGGAGSVGRMLVRRLHEADVNVVRIFDNNEPSLADMKADLGNGRLRYLSGDVRDKPRLERAMQDIDIVVHAAAMKHVDISEYNPFEAVKTNVMGLQNVIDTAIDQGVHRVVFTSSDKAVNPANTMGTTKLLGEKLITAGNKYSGRSDLKLGSVRFGNVVGSSGSVVPVFEEQIRQGGPVTVTNTAMTRFFLTDQEMVDLLMSAIRHTDGGEVFVRKMTAMSIETLATAMIDELAPVYGHDPDSIDIDIIGRRVGETVHEEIMTEREAQRVLETDDMYTIPPDTQSDAYLDYEPAERFEEATDVVRSSADADLLDRDEIVPYLGEGSALEADL